MCNSVDYHLLSHLPVIFSNNNSNQSQPLLLIKLTLNIGPPEFAIGVSPASNLNGVPSISPQVINGDSSTPTCINVKNMIGKDEL